MTNQVRIGDFKTHRNHMSTKIHIINHTHWDREWLLTSAYTNQWIPNLIDRVGKLVEKNPHYKFLLDGQTLVIEDLLKVASDYKPQVKKLIENGNLIIGPYYCQPDWRMIDGESLIRNILYGWQDVRKFGISRRAGWLVDNFGHISQAPQLHRMFGIDSVYVWRGAPQLEPYFHWQGANGERLFTINLVGGYRNLYGVTHVPEAAIDRLKTEVAKLQPLYSTEDIPLFDGYDLDQNPEDAILFYRQHLSGIAKEYLLCQSSDYDFAQEITDKASNLPTIEGELNSGKFGATFPGTLSSRTYLKILNCDCECLLYRLCEPLAVLARFKGRDYDPQRFETWGRALLQNAVHDCICGVGIDQVHEKMEHNYNILFQAIAQEIKECLRYILKDNAPGRYSVSTNPFIYEGWQVVDKLVYKIKTFGIGVWQVGYHELLDQPNEPVDEFHWQNNHYTATLSADGIVHIGEATLGYLVVSEERGDTYSEEIGDHKSVCEVTGPLVIERRSTHFCVVRFDCGMQWDEVQISARVRLTFDQTALLRWEVELDSRGTNFRVEMVFKTAKRGEIFAGMPFDVVKRSAIDTDLLPRQLDDDLANIFLGQRELHAVKTFPFQDFVGFSDGSSSTIVFAKGIRAYRAEANGTMSLPLRRSVEWLTIQDLDCRVGDAGPFMYVPDARCERTVKHELGILMADIDINDMVVQRINAAFQNPPLLVDADSIGGEICWQVLQEDLPMSSLRIFDQRVLARFYNPTIKVHDLKKEYQKTDVWGNRESCCREISAKEIVTLEIADPLPPVETFSDERFMALVNFPRQRVGMNHGHPSKKRIDELKKKIVQMEFQLMRAEEEVEHSNRETLYCLKYAYHLLQRELYELRLSVMLNEKKIAASRTSNDAYLYNPDPDIAQLGLKLNESRIKRRIYDYVAKL